jgi:hypothetical protein
MYVSSYSTIKIPFGMNYSFLTSRSVQPFVRLSVAAHFNKSTLHGYRVVTYTSDGHTEQTGVNSILDAGFSALTDVGVNAKLGPVVLGVRASVELMSSPHSADNIFIPYSMDATQLNYGVIGSIGYSFKWLQNKPQD